VDLQELASSVMREEGRSTTPFGLYVIPASDPRSELGRHVERAVFGEFFGETEQFLREEYDPYEPGSVFFIVIDHLQRVPAGVVRMIVPSSAGFKSLDDIERIWGEEADAMLSRTGLDVDLERCWDVATLAVMPDYRRSSTNGVISLALFQAISTLAAKSEVQIGVAVFDLVVLDLVQAATGRGWQAFPGLEPRQYLGSPASMACFCDVSEFGQRLAFTDPDLYEMLCLGRGLEAGVSPPEWDLDRRRLRAAS
jgi:hypothetical protein